MKVLISITRRVEYCTITEMSKDDYNKYDKMLEGNLEEQNKAAEEINKLIDDRDWKVETFGTFESLDVFKKFEE